MKKVCQPITQTGLGLGLEMLELAVAVGFRGLKFCELKLGEMERNLSPRLPNNDFKLSRYDLAQQKKI